MIKEKKIRITNKKNMIKREKDDLIKEGAIKETF